MVQSLLFKVGVPVSDYHLVFIEEGKIQHRWPAVVDWVRSECVGGVSKAKMCSLADVDQVLSPLGRLAADFPSRVVFVHVTCD